MQGIQKNWVHSGRSLHLNHGPIDLIIHCDGTPEACQQAYFNAECTFKDVLNVLVSELVLLRQVVECKSQLPVGPVALMMHRACSPFIVHQVTPMAAVAGAVADHMLNIMVAVSGVTRVWVNNGGDIALYLGEDETFACGMITDMMLPVQVGKIQLCHSDGIGGIATSGQATQGQGGRSFSLGIADAVTVLATTAAQADVAATLIANNVDLPDHSQISRIAATSLDPDSDLGQRAVVVDVGTLTENEITEALNRGAAVAFNMLQLGLIQSAVLTLQGKRKIVDLPEAVDRRMFA